MRNLIQIVNLSDLRLCNVLVEQRVLLDRRCRDDVVDVALELNVVDEANCRPGVSKVGAHGFICGVSCYLDGGRFKQ